MNSKVKNFLYNFRVLITTVCCLAGVSIFFINSNLLCNMIVKAFHLKVDPAFLGGQISADFFDDSEDDSGSGILRYPANSEFAEGSLDLVRYTVHKPVFNAQWQNYPDYWQLDLEFKNSGADIRNIMIYLNIDTAGNTKAEPLGTCSETLFTPAESVTFDPEHPWNYAVWISGYQCRIYDSNKEHVCDAELNVLNKGKSLKVRIPLKDKGLQRVYSAPVTYHYVLVGAYSKFDLGGFMPIEKRRSNSRGGTIKAKEFNTLIPKVYDILGDNSQLDSWDENTLAKAEIVPVCAQMEVIKSNKDENKEFISKVYQGLSQNQTVKNDDEYFGYENLEKALEAFEAKVKENPDSAVANAYYGSCLAMKGGQSSVVQAVNYVNRSFEYLNKAVELCKDNSERFEVFMNRASVCKSVPESVFGKSETGAADYVELAKLQKIKLQSEDFENLEYEKYLLAYFYVCASQCYETAGKNTEAEIMLQEAKKVIE